MRWASYTSRNSEHSLLMTHEMINVDFSNLSKHKELQWKLIALCGMGAIQNHQWIAPPKQGKKNKLIDTLSKFYPLLSDNELDLIEKINTRDELITHFKDAGYDDKSINEIFTEGKPTSKNTKRK